MYRHVVRQKAAPVSTKTLAALHLCDMKLEADVWLYVAAFDDEQENTLASGNELTIQK